jgi:hypothetical protein
MIHRDRGVIDSGGIRLRTEPLQETVCRYRAVNDWLKPILLQDESRRRSSYARPLRSSTQRMLPAVPDSEP